MRAKEQRHSTRAEVTVSIDVAHRRVDLWVSPEVADSLYVNNYQLVTGSLEREVTKCLQECNKHTELFTVLSAFQHKTN